ncbi:MAG: M56 family metallopeptidase [Bacteroidales bacterium]|nr:M56 family metallopeptidase [Bacteroidales bacterium]
MMTFFIYEAKVAVLLAVFYIFYRLLLSKESFHRLNRAVLLGTVALSFILPLCVITIHRVAPAVSGPSASNIGGFANLSAVGAAAVSVTQWWQIAIVAAYLTGVAVAIAKIISSVVGVARIISNGEIETASDGTPVIVADIQTSPFSWMSHIVMSRGDFESGNLSLVRHEKAHIALHHSYDVMFVDLVSVIQWFNPVIWMLRADLRAVHEFEADDAVLRSGANIKEYQYLLIRKAVSASGYSITNSFNHSILKNRITMMSKPKVSAMTGLRALYILPLLCGALALNAKTVFDYEISENLSVQQNPIKIEVKLENDKPVYYINGDKTNIDELGEKGANLIKNNEFGVVQLVVDRYVKMETLSDLKEELRKIGELNIEYFTVAPNENTESVPFQSIEVKPTFNGGDANEFSKWVIAHLEYPAEARAAGKQGRVMVKFTVNEDGKVSDVSVLRGIDPALDAEAVRVVNSSPNWKPGEKDGKKVPVTYTFPVFFQLSSPNMEKTGM